MRTNAIFDQAWHDLQAARRLEDIDEVINAAERLAYAAHMVKLEQQQREGCVLLDPKADIKYENF